jgi:glycosyltransferase involved in cell wall biosynthesis
MCKKVAHFIDTDDPGGAEALVIEICTRLNGHEFHPEVFHFGNPWLIEKCKRFNVPSIIVPGYKFYKSIKTLPFFTLIFWRFLKHRGIDLLHSHLFGPITGACLATLLDRIPHIGTLHDTYTIEQKESRIRLLQFASFFGTRLVTVSHRMQRYLLSMGKFPDGCPETIPNGVDLGKFSGSVNNNLRFELQLDANDIILISVGRLVPIKGYDILVEAFSKIRSNRHAKLLIVGDGPTRKRIEDLVRDRKIGDRVKLLGFRDDVPDLLRISDCFVLSSRSEGLSYSIVEAMASGLPLVVTNVGGNLELVTDTECGYLVPPNDPAALAQKLQILIDNDVQRKEFGRQALKIAQDKFSVTVMVDKYIKKYREMT